MRHPPATADDGLPLDARHYGDGDEQPSDVGPPCDGCGRREAVVEAGPFDLCAECADAVRGDLDG